MEHINIKIPIIGGETVAKDENDAGTAIAEAVIAFCIAAERFGEGIEKELEKIVS